MAEDSSNKTEALSAGGRRRSYNSHSMNERRSRIIAATLAIIAEEGLAGATIRNVSKRAGVALRTLYLYFESREAIIGVAIKEYFYRSIDTGPDAHSPETLQDVLDRFDRLSEIVLAAKTYSAALAPVYFSSNLDKGIYDILKTIALSHVYPFLDNALAAGNTKMGPQARELLDLQIANLEYAVIDDVLSGRLPERHLATYLKLSVMSFIIGYLPKPPKDFRRAMEQLHADLT